MNEGPVKNRRFKRSTVRNAIIGGVVLAVVLIVGGGGWFVISNMSAAAEKAELEARETLARGIAEQVQNKISATSKQLVELAKSAETIDLFNTADNSALSAAGDENLSQFEHALKLRYLIPGGYKLDKASVPPLSYASLALLNKAETTSKTNIEVHLFGTPNQHIVMIERVMNEGHELIGLLHLSLRIELLDELIKTITLDNGYVEVVQRGAGNNLVLAKTGNSNARQAEATTVSVNDTRWIIAYWPEGDAVAMVDSGSSGFPIFPVIIVLLVIAGAGAFLFLKKGGKGASDAGSQITYEGAVRAIAEGAHAGVEQLVPHLPKGERITANLKPISQGITADDATMISQAPPVEETKPPPATENKETVAEVDKPVVDSEGPTDEIDVPPQEQVTISPVIFRAYDIRGVVGETLSADAVYEIACAIGTRANSLEQQSIVVGRDGRSSGPELSEALIKGLRDTGINVIDIGMVPTPVLYFATHQLETGSGVMLTGSHNAPEYNGLKIMLAGNTLSGDEIHDLYVMAMSGEHSTGQGELKTMDISADYIRRISEDIPVALGNSLKIVVDCGNGVAGTLAPQLLNAMGHDVIEIYCDIDGNFPNHHPDPSQPENLQALIDKVKAESADIGFAFDGDGDRLGVVDAEGKIIWPDRQLMLLAKDVLSRNAGANIIFDVKCSRYLKSIIESNGGTPMMWKTGHSFIKNKMKEVDAPLAGEYSGHIFFKERWYGFDDALYTSARLIEIFTNAKDKPTGIFADLPEGVATPELRLPLSEDQHVGFMEELVEKMSTTEGEIVDIDGLRIEFPYGWGLARPSNTSPYIILRFEGEDEETLYHIQQEFGAAIQSIIPDVQLPF